MDYGTFETLRVEVQHGVASVVIDNPPINLFDLKLYPELSRLSSQLRDDDNVRVVVVESANPEFFIAHFDVSLILHLPTHRPAPTELNEFHQMCENFRTMPKPTISVIDGRVGGGGSELTLSMDMRFVSPNAVFSQPEVALGIIPGGSGTVRLSRLLGRSRAMEVIIGSEDIDARTAYEWGWVNRVVDNPSAHAHALARRIATFPVEAVQAAKRSILRSDDHVVEDLLAEAGEFSSLLHLDASRKAMENFLARGGQTREGELRLGSLVNEINDSISD
jgi:enoyl-CoA hydratase/carnithine racemase